MAKTYAKGSGSRKTKPTKDGEVQTAFLPAVAAGTMLLGAPALGYYLGSTIKLVKEKLHEIENNKKLREQDQEDKDLAKKK